MDDPFSGLPQPDSVGNCMQLCISYITGIPVEQTPHFALLGPTHAMRVAILWLRAQGYEVDAQKSPHDVYLPEYIAAGPSPRNPTSRMHAIVARTRGDAGAWDLMVYDPHPSNKGILGVRQSLYFRRVGNGA